jgi:hypothetical protein
MPTASEARLKYEAGQSKVAMAALTDSGDHKYFKSNDNFWSKRSGYAPNVKPDGLATGGAVTPAASLTNNDIDVAALTCYLAGVLTSVSAAADQACTRPSGGEPANTHIINSITVTAAGAIAVVAGTPGTSFSATRGAAGGPPLIDVGAIEIQQVKFTSAAAAPVDASEIFGIPGDSQERYDYPTWTENRSYVEKGVAGYAGVTFDSALPLIHTGPAAKPVYAEYYEPVFANIPDAVDFVPPEESHSVSSTQVYGRTVAASSKSLNQGSFSALMESAIYEGFEQLKGENLWFKFFPDRTKPPYIACQGILGVTRSFPAGDSIKAACTISSESVADDVAA